MGNDSWYLPENLEAQEEREIAAAARGSINPDNDFPSYYAYLKGINKDHIKKHILFGGVQAAAYAQVLERALSRKGLALRGNVLDLGCAIGTITEALRALHASNQATGIDISQSAIAAAKIENPRCAFLRQSADNLDAVPDASVDVIHAREFYPFTRTSDQEYQLKYLRLFHGKLKPGGLVVLQSRELPHGIEVTISQRKPEIAAMGFNIVGVEQIMGFKSARLYRLIPLTPVYLLLTTLEKYGRRLKRAPQNNLYILAKR